MSLSGGNIDEDPLVVTCAPEPLGLYDMARTRLLGLLMLDSASVHTLSGAPVVYQTYVRNNHIYDHSTRKP